MAVAEAQGADLALLAEVLPDIECAAVAGANGDPDEPDSEEA